jgi:pyridinium-3,5-biscarboxylic acid mononucleotide synthase
VNAAQLQLLLQAVASGATSAADAHAAIAQLPFEDLGFAKVDHHRELRKGVGEVVLGQGKTAVEIARVCTALLARASSVLVTRVTADAAREVQVLVPQLVYHASARTLRAGTVAPRAGRVAVVTAGTSDGPVADECTETLAAFGIAADRIADVGVAGIHRLFAQLERIAAADVVIAIAGMEAALPSVLGGLVATPLIAVPTSVGYGASFGGTAALLSALNCCASGVTVCNIDNGFGAAYAAHRILRAMDRVRSAA